MDMGVIRRNKSRLKRKKGRNEAAKRVRDLGYIQQVNVRRCISIYPKPVSIVEKS